MQCIIVLGNRNPAIMKKRVDRALQEFHSSPSEYVDQDSGFRMINKYLLFSGGSSDGVSKPEGAMMMEEYARSAGIEDRFMLVENTSRNTVENLRNSRKILDCHTMTDNIYKPTLVICTSSFHIKRSALLAKWLLKGFQLRFIHTNEPVSVEENRRELAITIDTLSQYCQGYFAQDDMTEMT